MPLLMFLALLPVIEIALFVEIGSAIGLAATLLWIVASALIGMQLIRYQGLATMARVQAAMESGGVPVDELSNGLCVIAAGFLLIVPGFLTDAIALLLLVGPLRRALGGLVWRTVDAGRRRGGGNFSQWQFSSRRSQSGKPDSSLRSRTVVDVEYEEMPPRDSGSGNS
ncbi:FxsA family protein [Radicibacter daui]|uniref:FxsA family protein n=1 Tax=Radicibacter daui TaxID=3064829 RepID=UPI0040468AAF